MTRAVVALAVFVLLAGMCGCASSQSNASSGASSPEQPASVSSSSTAKSSAKTDYLSERGYVISLQGDFDAPYSVLANDEARSFVREEIGKGTVDITESTEGCASGQKKVTATLQIVVDEQLGSDYLMWGAITAFDRTTGREFVTEDPFRKDETNVVDPGDVSVQEHVNNVTINGRAQAVPVKLTQQSAFPTFIDTLDYISKGGRMPKALSTAATLLSIRPVIGTVDGKVALLGQARGPKKGQNVLTKVVRQNGDVNFDLPFRLAYSGGGCELLKRYWEENDDLHAEWHGEPPVSMLGPVIGSHSGPGAIAVAFFENK